MAENSKIEWCDATFNPWIGCTKVSPACDHCYAERERAVTCLGVEWGAGKPRHRTSASNWALPLKWNRKAKDAGTRYRVFCASLADVFDNEVPVEWRQELMGLIAMTPHLDWLLLTKRIGNVAKMVDSLPPNVWLGASITSQDEADRDIPKLLKAPAAVRFLSCEPLLGTVNIESHLMSCDGCGNQGSTALTLNRPGSGHDLCRACTKGEEGAPSIDWVIVGGESGPKARPMHPDWVRSLRDQCASASVPFMFKQWGEWWADKELDCCGGPGYSEACVARQHRWDDGCTTSLRVGKRAAGRLLDCVEHNQFPGE